MGDLALGKVNTDEINNLKYADLIVGIVNLEWIQKIIEIPEDITGKWGKTRLEYVC
ncbi:MAG: hypothetical protein V3U88_05590 [Methylococcales bacterium]